MKKRSVFRRETCCVGRRERFESLWKYANVFAFEIDDTMSNVAIILRPDLMSFIVTRTRKSNLSGSLLISSAVSNVSISEILFWVSQLGSRCSIVCVL
jgi:hypothetical protein